MSVHTAAVDWVCDGDFAKGRYSRAHTLRFDGGVEVPGSSSPAVVPLPYSVEAAVDPEALFVASLSSCHMLWFLDLARQAGFVVARYSDAADGTLGQTTDGKHAMTEVVLRPQVSFTGERRPTPAELDALHRRAHDACFIANSVKTAVRVA